MSLWITAAVTAMALLIAGELAARRWIRARSHYYVWQPWRRMVLHPRASLFPQVEPHARFEVNAVGERGGAPPRAGDDVFRVLVAGGSSVECLVLDQPTSWPGVLERRLNEEPNRRLLGAHRVHVGNIGRSGIESRHLDLIFERLLPQYGRLDAILIMTGAADVIFWLEQGAPMPLPAVPVRESDAFAQHPAQTFQWRPKRLAAVELARRAGRPWLRLVEVRRNGGLWIEETRAKRSAATALRTAIPDPTPVIDRFELHFRRLLRRAQEHADHVIVMRQPWFEKEYTPEERTHFWHGGIGRAWKEPISEFYSLEVVNRLMGLIDERAARVADELDIPHVDLRRTISPGLDHFYDYLHFTPRAAALAAEEAAAALLDRVAPAKLEPTVPGASRRTRPAWTGFSAQREHR